MKNPVIVSAIGFAVAMACGAYVSLQAADITQFAQLQNAAGSRIPAAIRHDLDFSGLQGAELINASRKRLLTAARVILQDDQQGVELGHFVLRDESGRSQLACDFYDQVQITFAAEGIASSGEKPAMTIEGPCRADQDISQIAPIWIPVSRILAQTPGNVEMTEDGGNVHVQFENVLGEWPMRWALESIRLYNSTDSSREVTISHQEAHDIMNQGLELNWRMPASTATSAAPSSGEIVAPATSDGATAGDAAGNTTGSATN